MRLSGSETLTNKHVQDAISADARLTEHKTKLNRRSAVLIAETVSGN